MPSEMTLLTVPSEDRCAEEDTFRLDKEEEDKDEEEEEEE